MGSLQKTTKRNKRITEYMDNQHYIRRLCLDTINLGNHYASSNIFGKASHRSRILGKFVIKRSHNSL